MQDDEQASDGHLHHRREVVVARAEDQVTQRLLAILELHQSVGLAERRVILGLGVAALLHCRLPAASGAEPRVAGLSPVGERRAEQAAERLRGEVVRREPRQDAVMGLRDVGAVAEGLGAAVGHRDVSLAG